MQVNMSSGQTAATAPRQHVADRVIRAWDADRSGGISAAEAATAESGSRLASSFTRIDTDANGTVTRDELKADFRTYRRDGTIRGEGRDHDCHCAPRPTGTPQVEPSAPPAAPAVSAPTPAPATPPTTPARESLFEALIKSVDGNGDVRLSVEELESNPLANLLSPAFGSIDTDDDGLLSSREVDAFETAQAAGPAATTSEEASDPAEAATSGDDASAGTPSGPSQTYGTPQAVSLFESLFGAMTSQPATDTISIDRGVARDFLKLLAEIA